MSRKVTWRWATKADQPALDAMHLEMEMRIGHKMDRPDLFTEPVVCTVVGEVDGKIVQALYGEAELEICASSPNVMAPAEMMQGVKMLEEVARSYKIRLVRCFVPQCLVPGKPDNREWVEKPYRPSPLERVLLKFGFTREKPGYQQFFRWLVRRG